MSENSRTPLAGKVALVTGAARRVGRAIALALGEAGAAVAVHRNTSEKEADELVAELGISGAYARAFAGDLTDPATARRLVAEVGLWKGRLDILVNNASVFQRAPFTEGDDATWERSWDDALNANLIAPARLVRAAAGPLAVDGGVVVNLLDVAARMSWPHHAAYGASKAALEWLTRALAVELAPQVRVCGVAPGIAAFPDDMPEATRQRLIARVPLARAGTPDDVARAVVYLAGAPYVTGTVLTVDGGRLASTGEW